MVTLRILFFTLGAGSGVFLYSFPSAWVVALVAPVAGGLLWHRLSRLPALFVLGLCLSILHLSAVIERQLPVELEGVDLPLAIRVADLPESAGRSTRFLAEVIGTPEGIAWSEDIRLSWYDSPRNPVPEIVPGQVWKLTVRLKRPRGFSNPRGFDYQAWLLGNGIHATGYVRAQGKHEKVADPDAFSFAALRYRLLRQLFLRETPLIHGNFLRALVLGDRSGISQHQWDVLQATGTVHLMAISGLHVGLVASLGFLLGGGLRRILALLVGSRPAMRLLPSLVSMAFAGVYAGLAGFSIPTQRALIFAALANLAYLLFRRVSLYHLLVVCALAIVLLDPFAFLSPGFWLSFSAVLALFYLFSQRAGKTSRLRGALLAQGAMFVGMIAPLSLLVLPVSLAGPLANLMAVPVVSLVIIPALFVAVLASFIHLQWALPVLDFADLVFRHLWQLLELLASREAVWWHAPVHGWIALPVGILAALLLLAPRNIPFRAVGAALLLVFLFPTRDGPRGLRLTVLDVGQGLAAVAETRQATLLFDTGARFSDNFDVGSRIVAPYLIAFGNNRVDRIYVSHADNDHAGGLGGVLASLPVDAVTVGQREVVLRHLRKFRAGTGGGGINSGLIDGCRRGMRWDYGNLSVEALWPIGNEGVGGVDPGGSNNQSCVLLLSYAKWRILLPGDIEGDAESALLEAGLLPRHVDILVAPHHGSHSSSTRAFVKQVAPDYVVFSAGYKNRYGHPHADIVERYRRAGSADYNTATQGAITFLLNPQGSLEVHYNRETGRRPWYDSETSAE